MHSTLTNLALLLAITTKTIVASPAPHHRSDDGPDPNSLCTHPASFYIVNFEEDIYKLDTDSGEASVRFRFVDLDTDIDTECKADNITLTESSSGLHARHHHDHDMARTVVDRISCEDETAAFIFDPSYSGLTVIETVCPGASGDPLEASGSVSVEGLKLHCSDTDRESTCKSNEAVLEGDFVSFGPPPHGHGENQ